MGARWTPHTLLDEVSAEVGHLAAASENAPTPASHSDSFRAWLNVVLTAYEFTWRS